MAFGTGNSGAMSSNNEVKNESRGLSEDAEKLLHDIILPHIYPAIIAETIDDPNNPGQKISVVAMANYIAEQKIPKEDPYFISFKTSLQETQMRLVRESGERGDEAKVITATNNYFRKLASNLEIAA